MFNEILERRVNEATTDLRRKCAILEAAQTSSGKTAAALATHTEELLHLMRNIQFADDDPVAVARGVLSRVARLLGYNLDLLRKS